MQQNSIIGRRIIKSNIQMNISRQYSVTSLMDLNRLSSTMKVPFQLKQNTNSIKPQIRERIETLQQAVYRTQSFFER
jgi:hypothetical protein